MQKFRHYPSFNSRCQLRGLNRFFKNLISNALKYVPRTRHALLEMMKSLRIESKTSWELQVSDKDRHFQNHHEEFLKLFNASWKISKKIGRIWYWDLAIVRKWSSNGGKGLATFKKKIKGTPSA